jgi:hypothetical protein
MKTKMKKYEDGGSTRKARLEGRATKKMGKAQRTYKEAEATLSEAKSSGMKMDYADAEQLFNRSARQGDRAKKLKAKAAMMKKGGAKKPLRKAQDGMTSGPMTRSTVDYLDQKYPGTAMRFRGPVDPEWEAEQRDRVADTQGATSWGRASDLEKNLRDREERSIRSTGNRESFNTGDEYYKKGGAKKSTTKKPLMKKGGSIKTKMKTGGMVNSNSKVSALKVAGSKGVKSGVNAKASASKVAKGRSGGTSTAPKTAVPKAKYGMTTKPTMKRGGSMKKK